MYDVLFNKWIALSLFTVAWFLFVGCDMISMGVIFPSLARGKIFVKFFEGIEIIFCVPVAVLSLFIFFKTCNLRENRFINILASTTFGIYLFHDSSLNRQLIWDGILHIIDRQYKSIFFPVFAVLSIVLVFICGTVIDLLRQHLFERKILAFFKKYTLTI